MENTSKCLSHFGVPGMRWGKRNAVSPSSLSKISKKPTPKIVANKTNIKETKIGLKNKGKLDPKKEAASNAALKKRVKKVDEFANWPPKKPEDEYAVLRSLLDPNMQVRNMQGYVNAAYTENAIKSLW